MPESKPSELTSVSTEKAAMAKELFSLESLDPAARNRVVSGMAELNEELKSWSEEAQKMTNLSQEDFAVRINARS
jgi:hypothetical protein